MTKPTALVVCPGRGTYNRAELGYLHQRGASQEFLGPLDEVRREQGLEGIRELDSAKSFVARQHLKAENAAGLIFAAGLHDFRRIRQDYNVVAVTGNSMGWYTALACANVWTQPDAMRMVGYMAQLTSGAEGAQFIYPAMDSEWKPCVDKQALIEKVLAAFPNELSMSINYGGYAVFAGSEEAVTGAMKMLPVCDERFPMQLPGHAAFHSSFMKQAAAQAQAEVEQNIFNKPSLPLVDGRGHIWPARVSDAAALHGYTLGHQVKNTYNFSLSLEVAMKEFAPEKVILLGPGSYLFGAVAQSLIAMKWQGIADKAAFMRHQHEQQQLISMAELCFS